MALITKLNNIAQAIGNKTGEPASTYTLDNMPSAIANIQTAWPIVPDPDTTKIVRFIDYDGTIVTQMTLDEAKELTSLPEIPTHEGLTGVKWTHSLATIQSTNHSLDVGAIYQNAVNPDQTVFFMLPRVNEVVTLNFYQSATNGVTIDWGDGSATETVTGEGNVTATHTYATVDASETPLKLTFTPDNGVDTALGWGTQIKNVFGNGAGGYSTVVGAILGNSGIGDYAFNGCNSLFPVVISNSVTSIGNYVFQSCGALSSIVIPDSVTSIGGNVFNSCQLLSSVVFPDSLTSIGENIFTACTALSSIVIPDSVTAIPNNMFSGCTSLTSVVFPDSVTSIGTYAFSACVSLSSIVIPDSITTILAGTFSGCQALSSIVISDSVTSIQSGAFANCYSLSSIKFTDRTAMPTGSNWAFSTSGHCPYILDCSEFTRVPTATSQFLRYIPAYTRILVPASLETDWKAAANWSTYANQIVGV